MKRLLLLFCCLTVTGAAQDVTFQDLVNRKQYEEVVSQVDSLTAADSANYVTMYAIGQAYEGLLRYRPAYDYYRHCLAMDTTNIDMLNAIARTATNLGKAADAQYYFHKVLESDSTNFYANYQLARLYQQLGDYQTAIDQYTILREMDENNPVILRNIGDCYTRMEALPAAAICYFIAYSNNRENANLASALINTMLRLGSEEYISDALGICDTALYYNPGNRLLMQNKGMTLYMNKKYNEADSIYTELMAAGDSTYLTLKFAGSSRYYAGKAIFAVEPLELAYKMDTTSIDVNLLLGSSLGKTYDRKQAYIHFNKAEEAMKPEPVYVRRLLMFRADLLKREGKLTEAHILLYRAWQKEPSDLDLLSYIASSYNGAHISYYKNEDNRQRGIFIRQLYVKEILKDERRANEFKELFYYYRYFFESLYEDMFFRSVTEEPMLAPDGKKSKLNIVDLRSLINELPEMPQQERDIQNKYHEMRKKADEEFKKEKEKKEKEKQKN